MIWQLRQLLVATYRRIIPVGYSTSDLGTDLTAGLTVSVVAVPLGLVVAIAAGATPDKGLVGIIVGGLVIALFTASRFQIGGPTEACILIAVVVIEGWGYSGLMSATLLAGIFLLLMAFARIGILIESMPQAVISGFVTGMGIIIFAGQIVPFLGLGNTAHDHAHGHGEAHSHNFMFIVEGVISRLDGFDPSTAVIGFASLGAVLLAWRFLPRVPAYVVGLAVGAVAVAWAGLPVDTIGSTFGELPNRFPRPAIPELMFELAPYALAIAFLSSSESLLAASMASRARGVPSSPNEEFVALGFGNIAAAVWGGFPVGGCVARTATCLSSGAKSPLAGAFHAIFVALFVLFFSWALEYIPLASLAAVLLVVAARMIEIDRMRAIWRAPLGERVILGVSLGTTLFWDIRWVIPVGLLTGAVVFIQRISEVFIVRRGDTALMDSEELIVDPEPLPISLPPKVEVITFRGALFYGTVNSLSDLLADTGELRTSCVFGMRNVYFIDPTACIALADLVQSLVDRGTTCFFFGIQPEVGEVMHQLGLRQDRNVRFFPDAGTAVRAAEAFAAEANA